MTIKEYVVDFFIAIGIEGESVLTVSFFTLLLSALIISWLIAYVYKQWFIPIILHFVGKSKNKFDDYFINQPVLNSLGNLLPALIFYKILPYTHTQVTSLWYIFFEQSSKIYIAIMVTALLVAFLNNLVNFTSQQHKYKGHHIPTIIQFLKLLLYFLLFIIVIALIFERNPINIIAGLGAAATVLMLVFKDSILGFVAGIQLSVNNMVKPGDWVTIAALDIDGVIENVSLTTVKIRNFDNTISTVPPYTLISETFQNWDPMFKKGGRRVKRALYIDVNSIRFMTEEEIRQAKRKKLWYYEAHGNNSQVANLTIFRHYVEHYLHSLSYVIDEDFVLARQLAPTQQGLPLEIWFYSNITAFAKYESLAAETIENIISVMPMFGLRLYQAPSGYDFSSVANTNQQTKKLK